MKADNAGADTFPTLHNIVKAAREKLDGNAWDYLIGGADTETTVKRNRRALDRWARKAQLAFIGVGFAAKTFYNIAKAGFADGAEDWDTLTYKVTLVTSAYLPDPVHSYASAFSGAEVNVDDYAVGFGGSLRKTLTGKSVVENDTDDRSECHADDATWTTLSAGNTIEGSVVIREVTSDGLSPLIAYVSGGMPLATDGGNLTVTWNSAGVFGIVSA